MTMPQIPDASDVLLAMYLRQRVGWDITSMGDLARLFRMEGTDEWMKVLSSILEFLMEQEAIEIGTPNDVFPSSYRVTFEQMDIIRSDMEVYREI